MVKKHLIARRNRKYPFHKQKRCSIPKKKIKLPKNFINKN